nr:MAG TPA: hypothetical protein [Caudoviricetes sp.]
MMSRPNRQSINNFERLLNHKCDIYHITDVQTKDYGYGVVTNTESTYPSEPDLVNVSCHFQKESINVVQSTPQQNIEARIKVDFPLGTDVRLNDKIIYKGLSYYAEVPSNVRNHHITVYCQRKGQDSYVD